MSTETLQKTGYYHTITRERLNALSPVEKTIAEDAIRFGFWKLIDDNKEE